MKDISGMKFNKLTIIRLSSVKNKHGRMWQCVCDCGVVKDILGYKVTSGETKSCGCIIGKTGVKGHRLNDLTGMVFGTLTVKQRAENAGNRTAWICICDCGKNKVVESRNLVAGVVKSCGCSSNSFRRKAIKSHGMSKTKTYKSWVMMKSRCLNENYSHYSYYGGRGIKVCDEWLIFENFLKDMGDRPKGTTLDRVDSDLGYYKENCRWAKVEVQCENKRSSKRYTINGETKSLDEWAAIFGTTRAKLYNHMYRDKTECLKTILIKLKLIDDE